MNGVKVLVVDDDPMAGEMSGAILEDAGFLPLVFDNVVDALESLGSDDAIALVVADMNMPLMTGLDLVQEMRHMGMKQPFILLSGDENPAADIPPPRPDACLLKDEALMDRLVETAQDLLRRSGHTP